MIDRRTFLRRLGYGTVSAAAASCVFDIEKLLWVPGEKTIVLPALVTPRYGNVQNVGQLVADAWLKYVGSVPADNLFKWTWLEYANKGDTPWGSSNY